MTGVVAYYRVSTKEQGRSGLGLQAQRSAVQHFAQEAGHQIIQAFEEVESGKSADRPRLAEAMKLCQLSGARLVIAKLDRLSRNVHFISSLMESGIGFTAVDMPQANEFTIHIMAALSEQERKLISERTKAALKAAKERGVTLGNPRLAEARAKRKNGNDMSNATATRQAKAKDRAMQVMSYINQAIDQGDSSLQQIADYLNDKTRVRTPRGKEWTRVAVSRVLKHADMDFPTLMQIHKEQKMPDHYGDW